MRTYKAEFDKDTVIGNAVEIMQRLREEMFDPSICKTMPDYLKWLTQNIWRLENITITIPSGTEAEQCQAVLEQLIMLNAVDAEPLD